MGPRKASFEERILVGQLKNGLRVVLLPDARTNLVTVGVNYNVGGSDDPVNSAGLAHYVEHILYDVAFQGSDGETLRPVGLTANAMTGFDRTYFYATSLEQDLDRLLEVAARRFEASCSNFDDAILARERDVVIEENKYRAQGSREALMRGIWGGTHPYAHGPLGTTFKDITRDNLCKFIEQHYGPGSAVLVVTGNVQDADLARVRARFEPIRARAVPVRARLPAPAKETARVTIANIDHPYVALVLPVPGEGSDEDGAIELAGGMSWVLSGGEIAHARLIGEERARAIVVMAPAEQTSEFGEVENALREAITKPPILSFAFQREQSRLRAVKSVDDVLAAGSDLAVLAARQQPVTRFRRLRQLDAARVEQAKRWFDPARARVVYFLPEIGAGSGHDVDALATSLHHVEVPRPSAPTIDVAIRLKQFASVEDYRLSNGLRVLLAPDSSSVGIDARLVVTGTPMAGELDQVPTQAAWRLTPRVADSWEVHDAVEWYTSTVGSPMLTMFRDGATVFNVSGLGLFGDWHVWNLGVHIVDGYYPRERDDDAEKLDKRQPDAVTVVARRLARVPGDRARPSMISSERLESFRQASYRPERSTLIVAGKFDAKAMRNEISTVFGRWRSRGAAAPPTASERAPSSYIAIPADDGVTVQVVLAFSIATSPSDATARAVMVEMLNDQLREVREGLGASYGVRAKLVAGAVVVVGDVEPAYASDAASAIATAIARVRAADAALADDFARVRAAVLVRALAQPIGASNRAAALERLAITGSGIAELDQQVTALQQLDLASVQRTAARDLDPAHVIIAARAKGEKARAALIALGAKDSAIQTLAPQGAASRRREALYDQLVDHE
jgi:zinc protease